MRAERNILAYRFNFLRWFYGRLCVIRSAATVLEYILMHVVNS